MEWVKVNRKAVEQSVAAEAASRGGSTARPERDFVAVEVAAEHVQPSVERVLAEEQFKRDYVHVDVAVEERGAGEEEEYCMPHSWEELHVVKASAWSHGVRSKLRRQAKKNAVNAARRQSTELRSSTVDGVEVAYVF